MTRLHNPNFISLDGEPITGRVPPRIQVFGPATKEQLGALTHEYKLFYDCVNTMVGKFLSRDRVLSDGSRIRLTSNSGLDDVMFWPSGGGENPPLDPNGYLVYPTDKEYLTGWDKAENGDPISPYAHISATDIDPPASPVPPIIKLHSKYKAGTTSWIGKNGVVLTWNHLGYNRYGTNLWDTALTSYHLLPGQGWIYYRGTTIHTPTVVSGAAIFKSFIVYIYDKKLYYATSPIARINKALASGTFLKSVSPLWTAIEVETDSIEDANHVSTWHFHPEGHRAACAVVFKTFGPDTWDFWRMRQEVLPQAKRYMDLQLDDSTVPPKVTAALSEEAYATSPIATRIGGVVVEYSINYGPVNPSTGEGGIAWYDGPADNGSYGGAISCTGHRLLGIDYDAEGNELVISLHCAGSGTVSHVKTIRGFYFSTASSCSSQRSWSIYSNDTPLITALELVASASANYDSESTVGAGSASGVLCDSLSIHDIDARFGLVVCERLRRQIPSATASYTFDSGSPISIQVGSATATVETWLKGELVRTQTLSHPPGSELTARINVPELGAGGHIWRGMSWVVANSAVDLLDNHMNATFFPMIQGKYGENTAQIIFKEYQARNGGATQQDPSHLRGYPNQISDATLCCFGGYRAFLHVFHYVILFGPDQTGFYPDSDNISLDFYPNQYEHQMLDLTEDGDGIQGLRRIRGFARRTHTIDHHVIATKNTYFRGFWQMLATIRAFQLGLTAYLPPMCEAAIWVRPPLNPEDPEAERLFVRHDLMVPMADKIDNEVTGSSVDRPSLRIDPICVI